MQPHQLVGTWKLLSNEFRFSNGSVSYPWGRDAEGLLIYSEDGYMMTSFCSANRARFVSDDLAKADPNEYEQAARTYISYGGSYELHGNKLIHHVLMSLFPNWVGQPQIRIIEHLEGDHLTLATEPATFAGQSVQGFFHWKRVEEAGQ
jgi:Lipocalin-like domain